MIDRSIPLLLIGLVFGGFIGFTVAASNGITLDGHGHADPADHGGHTVSGGHDHGEMLSLPENAVAPTLAVRVMRDPSSGWNLHMETENLSLIHI